MTAEAKLKVFISYSRKDQAFAGQLVEALGHSAFDAYLDVKDIAPGEPWQERLGKLIEVADTVVFVLSDDSVRSPICAWEIDEAERLNKRILPVVCRTVELDNVPGRIRRLNWIVFATEADFPAQLSRLTTALLTDITWIREHTRLGEIAGRWTQQGRRDDLLLRGQALGEAELWISQRPRDAPEPSDAHRQLIQDSRKAEVGRSVVERAQLDRERRLQRRWAWALGAVGMLVVVGLASVLWQNRLTFEREARVLTNVAAAALKDDRPDRALRLALAGLPPTGALAALSPWSPELEEQLAEAARRNHLRRVIRSSSGSFDGIVISEDGTRALSLELGQLRIWDTVGSRVAASLEGRHTELRRAAFSPDGARIAVQTQPDVTELFDVVSGRRMRRLEGHAAAINSLVFSADGAWIATGSDDATARLWNGLTGNPVHVLRGHGKSVLHVVFSGDGARVATAASEGRAAVWDVRTGADLKVFTHLGMMNQPYPVSLVALNADGSRLASASASFSNQVRLWDVTSGIEVGQLHGHSGLMASLRFNSDGSRLVSHDINGQLQLWDGRSGAQVWQKLASGGDSAITFSADGQLLVVAVKDTAEIKDTHSGATLVALRGHDGSLRQAALTPDGASLVTASHDKTVRVWDLGSTRRVAVLRNLASDAAPIPPPPGVSTMAIPSFPAKVSAVAYSPDGRRILTAGDGRTVFIHDARTSARQLTLIGADSVLFDASFSPDGARVLVSGLGKVWVWNAHTGDLDTVIEGPTEFVRSAVFSPDGVSILTASNDKTVRLWTARTGREMKVVARHDDGVTQAVFSADGRHVASAGLDRRIKIVDVESGAETHAFTATDSVLSVAFAPDGRWLVAAVGNNAIIWDLATRAPMKTLKGHLGTVWRVHFDTDGRRLATGSADGTVRLWDVATGTELATLNGFDGMVRQLAFDPSGPRLVAASGTSAAILDLSSIALHSGAGLRDHACNQLLGNDGARAFSAQEMADPILRGRDDLANPCRRRGPLALDYWTRIPGELWTWTGAQAMRIGAY